MKVWHFVALIALAIILPSFTGCMPNYSNGDRVGHIVKLSHKGLFVKTWEAQMVLGGVTSRSDADGNSQMVANTFEFTLDPSEVDAAQAAMAHNMPVRATYHQYAWAPMTSSEYVVTSIEQATE